VGRDDIPPHLLNSPVSLIEMSQTLVWTLVETPSDLLDEQPGFLTAPERQKLSSLRFPKRREEWLRGRWAAKSLVHGIPPYQQYSLDEIEIRNDPAGAPHIFLSGDVPSPDCLSISHRDRLAFCALVSGPDLRIGADIETVEPRSDAFVADYFTVEEQGLVHACPPETREAVVTLIWSAKEAMLKALGVGLHWDTRQVEVRAIGGSLSNGDGPNEWQELRLADREQADRPWLGRWQRRGSYLLTLASFGEEPVVRLVEKPALK
jgi:4'-phosphopantetheinyl transferase